MAQTHKVGKQQVVVAGHLADDHQGRERRLGRGGEESRHAHDDKSWPGCGTKAGQSQCRRMPRAPPPQPPITIEGPKTPPEPPLPMVRLVVRILPRATASRSRAREELAPAWAGSVMAS